MLTEQAKLIIERRLGRNISSPHDCSILMYDIKSVTGESVGLNTLKRMFGFIESNRDARLSTLDVMARYAGYRSWTEVMTAIGMDGDSGFEDSDDEFYADELPVKAVVEFEYCPDRRVVLVHEDEDDKFVVTESVNSKLRRNDVVFIRYFQLHYPLYVDNVIRDGKMLGKFAAGKANGLTRVEIMQNT